MIPIGRRPRPGTATRDEAETIALRGLMFLSSDEGRLARFLGLTGLEPSQLRQEAQSSWFLAAVLDHLLSDESLLLVFCAEMDIEPAVVVPARRLISPDEGEAF